MSRPGRSVEITERSTVFDGFLRVDRLVLSHSGFAGGMVGPMTREVMIRADAVGILPYDPRADVVVLIEQFRPPAYLSGHPGWMIEVPAGMADGDEPVDSVARRELAEETGLEAGRTESIARYMPSNGGTQEWVDLLCAEVTAKAVAGFGGVAAEHEDLRILTLPAAGAIDRALAGGIDNAQTLICLLWLALNRERVRRLWTGEPVADPSGAG